MHPRNRHSGRYDFNALVGSSPDLARFVAINAHGDESIDFADPDAVKALNRAMLASFYGISRWDLPPGYLCPPVPGRSDYVHSIADLLAECNSGEIPHGPRIRVLDLGVGASCIYPIVGFHEYGWSFVGTDADEVALSSARHIAQNNPSLADAIELRLQPDRASVLNGVLKPNEKFDLLICNPPFHSSLEEAAVGSRRKWRNLGRVGGATKSHLGDAAKSPRLNFGGHASELAYPGGEVAFIRQLIKESVDHAFRFFTFSSLVSKDSNLDAIYQALDESGAADTTIEIVHGQKKSRVVAWTFLDEAQQARWRAERWTTES